MLHIYPRLSTTGHWPEEGALWHTVHATVTFVMVLDARSKQTFLPDGESNPGHGGESAGS